MPARSLAGERILVTGATGILGRHLVRRLLGLGAVPSLLVRPERIDALRPEAGPCPLLPGRLEAPETLAEALRQSRPGIVFHLAAFTDPVRDPGLAQHAIAANLAATVALATAAMDIGCDRFVTTGSAEEYGQQPAPLSEDLPERPLSPYSASKAATTQWLRMLGRTHGFPGVVLRPFLIYGPGQAPQKLVPSAILAALDGRDFPMTSGRQTRELTFVEDAVDALLAAATRPIPDGTDPVFNLGSGDERSVLEIVERIFALSGAAGTPVPGAIADRRNDMQRFVADTTRAAEILGWRATTPLDTGLARTIDWARAHGDTPIGLCP
jgi:nucleoside-diphosphate-sugar epimerase